MKLQLISLKQTPIFIIAFGFVCIPRFSVAQSIIHGKVLNAKNEPAASASVLLLQSKDSSLIKAAVCDNKGMYAFSTIKDGNYIIEANYLGYKQAYSNVFVTDKTHHDITVDNITLTAQTAQLNDVTVTVKKPFLEQKIDRLVINVASSITSAGNTALEVLERSPGVIVDRQNNTIAINGKDGVVVMLNGKKNYMPMTALVQMLNGMSANNIEKIELITTPPASFDAEGNAGYINIVMKQINSFGTNGAASATLGYGKGMVSEAAFNINHRKGKINIYGDISYSRIKKPFTANGFSKISNNDIITETDFIGDRHDTTMNINGRLGLDWQANKKTVAGILFSGFDRRYTQSEHNLSRILTDDVLDTIIYHNNNEYNSLYSYNANINLQHNFNEMDKLIVNVDYIYYHQNQPVNYSSIYNDNNDKFVYDRVFRSGKKTPMHFWVGTIDYSKKLAKNVSLEAGFKQTFSAFDNDINFENFTQNTWVKDDSLSSRYKLKEDYTASYASFDINVDSATEIKAGLRYEHTNSNLGTVTIKNIVDRHYGNFFPSFFITRKLNGNSSVDFSYSRRITRPTFNDLAPFTYYINANTVLTGNPSLQPSLSDNFKADYTYRQYLFSFSYSKENNAIAGFQPHTDSVSNKEVDYAENLINQKTAAVVIAVPLTITKWWNGQVSTTALWQQTNTLYKGDKVSIEQKNISLNASMRFTLPKNYSAEITGLYQSEQLFGIYKLKPFGSLNIGIKKTLRGKLGSLSLNATDILNTFKFRLIADLPAQNLVNDARLRFSVPTVRLTYSLNFGNNELKQKRERETGAEDESGRVHTN